ncbi:hypothetical protein BS028_09165 [Vibrio parahaemolyticus]|nr:hypothetical protein [Vibrio parahaemolyticus]
MNFNDLRVEQSNFQSIRGSQVFRKLRTFSYEFFDNEKLVAYFQLETMNISDHHPTYIWQEIDNYQGSDWEVHSFLFDNGCGFNSVKIDLNASGESDRVKDIDDPLFDINNYIEYYHKIGLISLAFIDKDYRNKGLLRSILKHLFVKHYDIGVFFLNAIDLRCTSYFSAFKEINESESNIEKLNPIYKLGSSNVKHMKTTSELKSIYTSIGFKPSKPVHDSAERVYLYIEPLEAYAELFTTESKRYKRFDY